jgi:predicted lipoprotein
MGCFLCHTHTPDNLLAAVITSIPCLQLAIEQLFEGYKLVRVQQAGLEVTVDKLTADNQKLTAENKKIKGWLLKLLKQQGMEEAVAELQEHEDVVGVEDS